MKRNRLVVTLLALAALLLTTGGAMGQGPDSEGEAHPQEDLAIAATVNSRISYQGRLLESGSPVTGSRDMLFRLYSDGSCTAQVGSDIVKNGVTVSEGLFSVELDVTHGSFNGQGLWLEVEVGTTILGCQEILPVPYALSLRPGAKIEDWTSILYLNRYKTPWPAFDMHKYGIEAEVDGNYDYAFGVHGSAHTLGGVAYGLHGSATTDSGTAYGVYGQSATDSLDARGVYGTAPYTGVEGHATATDDATSGVYGQTDSPYFGAAGVYGQGGYYGVRGIGAAFGVYGEGSDDLAGAGVYGKHTGDGHGVYGQAISGVGVYGESDSGVGVRAISNSDTALWAETAGGNAAVDARHTGAGHGIFTESAGPGIGGSAIYARANHDDDGIAIRAISNSSASTLYVTNQGSGDLIRASRGDGTLRFRVENDGRTTVSVLAITGGVDLAERFDVAAASGEVAPGLAVCIDVDYPGRLLVCTKAYDHTVAGVVSGAGGIEPGMVLGQEGSPADGDYPVALTGRVYVWADASAGPIEPGDLLTTSDIPGHVIRVSDYARAQGAIIGKAMSSLEGGQGLILVLVSLQ
jgi:hypothetical protein